MKFKNQLSIVLIVRFQEKLERKIKRKRYFLHKIVVLIVLTKILFPLMLFLSCYQERF